MLTQRNTRIVTGLSTAEAQQRLQRDGFNELPAERQRSLWRLAFDILREPMIALLIVASLLYVFLGDPQEAVLLVASIGVVIGIELYQEERTEKAVVALRDLSSPRALALRDGEWRRIPGREVVVGDLVSLMEGDRVPADGVVVESINLAVDESLLTGESLPAPKMAGAADLTLERPGGDNSPYVYSGTMVTQGHGQAIIQATGPRTEMGRIGASLQAVSEERSPLQREVDTVVKVMASGGLALCLLVALLYGLARANWLEGLLSGITLAMSLVPEEFPVILTIFLAFGAWRIAKRRVLTRRIPSMLTLGATTTLCTDKTGTLTLNQMAVAVLHTRDARADCRQEATATLAPDLRDLVGVGMLASQQHGADPMDAAFWRFGAARGLGAITAAFATIREYPVAPPRLAFIQVWRSTRDAQTRVAAKGAPETIATLCQMAPAARIAMLAQAGSMAAEGLRVLGVASAAWSQSQMPDDPADFPFDYLGLVGLADPVRPDAAAAVAQCRAAGVRVVMITGDYPDTARAIAKQIGLANTRDTLTGKALEELDDAALRRRVAEVDIYARVIPEEKLRLVQALKATGAIVAMTGDGVNDAPALKAAHIGIAMGGRGTDVAREAAGLVLLDDDFASIVAAIALGRRIYENLRKAMGYVLGVHVPIAGLALAPVLLGEPLILLPIHIVFLELIIDPACSLVFEAEPAEGDVMRQPPRDPQARVFNRALILTSLLQGASVLAAVLGVYQIALRLNHPGDEARALAFTTLIIANLGLILVNRSWRRLIWETLRTPNPMLWWVVGGAAVILTASLVAPPLRDLFQFAPLHGDDIALCLGAGALSIAWFEGFKLVARWRSRLNAPRLTAP